MWGRFVTCGRFSIGLFRLGFVSAAALIPLALAGQERTHPRTIASFSVGSDQTLNYPNKSSGASPYLLDFPDEHTTFMPLAGTNKYLVFGSSRLSNVDTGGGAVVLETSDLTNFAFATSLGYNSQVMAPPEPFMSCNITFDSGFDENYAGPGSVVQDPTLPSGNFIIFYEAENHCPGGVNQQPYYATVGFARSSDYGKTWPAPVAGALGDTARHPVLRDVNPEPLTSHPPMGDAIPSAFVDERQRGRRPLIYIVYGSHPGPTGTADGLLRVATASLDADFRLPIGASETGTQPEFFKWYNGAFSQPGVGGLDSGVTPSIGCTGHQDMGQISYNDDLGLYLLTFVCVSKSDAAWYYSTATDLALQNWSVPQQITGSALSITNNCGDNGTSGQQFDGWYPSFMSPGVAAGHTRLTGMVFYMNGCDTGTHEFMSRTFTIAISK